MSHRLGTERRTKSVSVVIPTWKRSEWLSLCLDALADQTRVPDEVIVVGRKSDLAARNVVERKRARLPFPLIWTKVDQPGHVQPVLKGLKRSQGDIVAFLDDDVEPAHDWLECLLVAFSDPGVVCVGGRVLVEGPPPKVPKDAGRIRWYGKFVANVFALDSPETLPVDGVGEGNWAWERKFLETLEFDPLLDFEDARFYGLDLTLAASSKGYRTIYQPKARVRHHMAPRTETIARVTLGRTKYITSRNYTYIALKHFHGFRRWAFLFWWFLIGERGSYGLIKSLADVLMGKGGTWYGLQQSMSGKLEGIRLAGRRRRELSDKAQLPSRHRPRIIFLSHFPNQYSPGLFRYLSTAASFEVRVLFLEDPTMIVSDPELGHPPGWDTNLLEGYSWEQLPWRPVSRLRELFTSMRQSEAVVVPDWAKVWTRIALLLGVLAGARVIFHTDSTGLSPPTPGRAWVRRAALRSLTLTRVRFGVTGNLAYRHIIDQGINPSLLHRLPYSVDNDWIVKEVERERARRKQTREEILGRVEEGTVVFLAVAKLIEREGVEDLVRAFVTLGSHSDARLLIVGDGPQIEQLRDLASARAHAVNFLGYQPYSQLPKYYAVADVFVHVARSEPWGLSVNEASAAGLPLILAPWVGVGADLLEESSNGFIVEGVGEIRTALSKMIEMGEKNRLAMGARSAELSARVHYEAWSQSLHTLLFKDRG